jgi:hypothetical protein
MPRLCHPSVELLEGRLLLAVYTVTNTDDSGPGSLRQAILDSNADHMPDSILFNMPGSGVQTIEPLSPLPRLDPYGSGLVIDGTSQPGYAAQPLIEVNGSQAGANVNGLESSDRCTIEGLDINDFSQYGIKLGGVQDASVIQDNCIGTDPTGTISMGNGTGIYNDAPGSSISHNLISGNRGDGIDQGSAGAFADIEDNLIGTDVSGTTALGNGGDGILPDARATISRNVISGNGGNGIFDLDDGSVTVTENLVGTDISGTRPLGNRLAGMLLGVNFALDVRHYTVIGNVVANNGGDGITLHGRDSTFQNNQIVANGGNGISISDGYRNLIGGPGAGNVIAYNAGDGILARGQGTFSFYTGTIRCNSIFANGNLGIELTQYANNGQEAPVLDLAVAHHHRTIMSGTLTSTPDTNFTIDFFASSTPGPQGEDYVTSIDVTTDDNGFAAFTTRLYGSFSGQWITATATDSSGDTSEFSPPIDATRQWAFLAVCLDRCEKQP